MRLGKILPKIFQGLSGFLGTQYTGVRRLGIRYLPEYSHKNRMMLPGHDNAYYVLLRSGYIETTIEGNLMELKVYMLTE